MHITIDDSIDGVTQYATSAQDKIYKAILASINDFETRDGRYISNQSYAQRLAILTRKIENILGDIYTPSVKEYLGVFSTIEDTTISLQKSYNELEVSLSLVTPIRKSIYSQAEYFLTDALADAYIQPAKHLLMQHVTQGITISDSLKIFEKWNKGELSTPDQLASNRPTPNLQKYATQLSRDSIYGYQGAINDSVAEKFNLNFFLYIGGIIRDSRPACRHLVGLNRKISIDEIPQILLKYPEGVMPGTTKDNFWSRRCGYGCRHEAFPVKG